MRFGKQLLTLVLGVALAASPKLTHSDGFDDGCDRVRDRDSEPIQLYYRTAKGEIKPVNDAPLWKMRGRATTMYLMLRRGPDDLDFGRLIGAASVKIELWQSDGDGIVWLRNNRPPEDACQSHHFWNYQRFHADLVRDSCLFRFHNLKEQFSTLVPMLRRKAFLFPESSFLNWYERLRRIEPQGPIKRMSQIYYYGTSRDHPRTCITIRVTPSMDAEAMRITVHNLLEGLSNEVQARTFRSQ